MKQSPSALKIVAQSAVPPRRPRRPFPKNHSVTKQWRGQRQISIAAFSGLKYPRRRLRQLQPTQHLPI